MRPLTIILVYCCVLNFSSAFAQSFRGFDWVKSLSKEEKEALYASKRLEQNNHPVLFLTYEITTQKGEQILKIVLYNNSKRAIKYIDFTCAFFNNQNFIPDPDREDGLFKGVINLDWDCLMQPRHFYELEFDISDLPPITNIRNFKINHYYFDPRPIKRR